MLSCRKGSRLTIRKASPGDSGRYVCRARNVGGSVTQEAVIKVGDGIAFINNLYEMIE